MSIDGLAALVTAVAGAATTLGGALVVAYRAIKAQVRAELAAEQGKKTLDAKNEEISELKAENKRLWDLVEGLTRPSGK